ncbi:hypothetical protein PSACC_03428 [Paramicrosporidium saccamoebae]|uniref:Uncharacterized protein n=1 Tax=Paramicrosporidium saccamoebae TaxID=1246581 RepID=A0A2H9TFY1_9FUNG|nr:hypothetical protein PSACC_03428 [Paramicrosporidium saccamoebae]
MKINLLVITAKLLALTTATTVHHHNYNRGPLRPQIVVINHHFHNADTAGISGAHNTRNTHGGMSANANAPSAPGSSGAKSNTPSAPGSSGAFSVPNASASGASSVPNAGASSASSAPNTGASSASSAPSTPAAPHTPAASTAPAASNAPAAGASSTPKAAKASKNSPPTAQFKENTASSPPVKEHKLTGSVFGASHAAPPAAGASSQEKSATKSKIPAPPGPAPILSKPNKAPKPCVPVPSSNQSQTSPTNATAASTPAQQATKSTVPPPPGPAPILSQWKPKKAAPNPSPATPSQAAAPAATNSTTPILNKPKGCKPINVSGTVPASAAPSGTASSATSASSSAAPGSAAPGSATPGSAAPATNTTAAPVSSNTATNTTRTKDDTAHLVGDYVSTAKMLKILQTPGAPLPWKWQEQCYNSRVSHCGPVFKTAARDINLYGAELDTSLRAPTTVFPSPTDLRFRTLTAAGAVLGGKLPAFKDETIPYHTYAAMEMLIGTGLTPVASGESSAQKKVVNVAPFVASRGQLKTHLSPIVRLGLHRLAAALLSLSNTKFTSIDDELRALLADAQHQPFTLAVLLKHVEGEQLRRTLSKEHRAPPLLQAGIYHALTVNVPDTLNLCHPNAQLPAISVHAHFLKKYGSTLPRMRQIVLARAFLYLVFGVPFDRSYCKNCGNPRTASKSTARLLVNGILASYCRPRSKYHVVVN